VIGGIITEEKSLSENRVPRLGKIPVVGWLFKQKANQSERTELLIFITTTIVEFEEGSV